MWPIPGDIQKLSYRGMWGIKRGVFEGAQYIQTASRCLAPVLHVYFKCISCVCLTLDMCILMKYMCDTPDSSLVVLSKTKRPLLTPYMTLKPQKRSFISFSNLEKWPYPKKGYSKTYYRSFLAPKQKELSNIRVNRNCQANWCRVKMFRND